MPTINPTNNPAHPSNFRVDTSRPTTHNELVDMWHAFRTDGFDDAELNKFIRGAVNTGDVNPYGGAIMHAVVTPTMPEKYLDQGKFLEVLAWYIDKSSPGGGHGDGDGHGDGAALHERAALPGGQQGPRLFPTWPPNLLSVVRRPTQSLCRFS